MIVVQNCSSNENIMRQKAILDKFFGGRTLVVATRHQKEAVLKPLLEQALNVKVVVPNSFDTDEFGTFSGEVEREASPLETARRKCIAAHKLTGEDLVLASEGSFGGHPVLGFLPADEEILLLKDFKHGFETKAKVISTRTNFAGNEYCDWDPVLFFASQVNFPSHGLIVRRAKDDYTEIHKGITDWQRLKESFYYFQKKWGKAYIETDMRALYNPTRLKVIREAAEKLIDVINSHCPVCNGPGFEIKEVVKGLPCSQCSAPTQSVKAHLLFCQHCGYAETKSFPHKKEKEDPMYCDDCNP
jgi:Zn finger protein HypA/HybF involved in hydrogenase expression